VLSPFFNEQDYLLYYDLWIESRPMGYLTQSWTMRYPGVWQLPCGRIIPGTEQLHHWLRYGQRLARAWNGCLLAAEVCGLSPEAPALVLADRCDEAGEPRLAALLRCCFQSGYQYTASDQPAEVLPDPAEQSLPIVGDHYAIV
jgi:hypothetical protein